MNSSPFVQRIEDLRDRISLLVQSSYSSHLAPEYLLKEALATLETSLEELCLTQEELQLQNQKLINTRKAVDAERQRYQELFELAPDAYLVIDMGGLIQEANQAAAKMLNVEPRFLVEKPLIIFVAEQERWTFYSELKRFAQIEQNTEWEIRLQPRQGKAFDASLTVAKVQDLEGKSVALRLCVRNITERKQVETTLQVAKSQLEQQVQRRTAQLIKTNATLQTEIAERKHIEQELRESEERFRTCLENMLDAFATHSAIRDASGTIVDFRIDYVNAAACESNCMTREQQLGNRLLELLPGHKESGLFDEYCQVVETGKPLVKESLVYEDVYGEQRLKRAFDLRVTKLGDGYAINWRDISDRKKAEEERDRFFTLSLDMLCIAGVDGYFKRLNPAFGITLGYTQEELLSKPFLEFVHPEDKAATIAEMEKLQAGGLTISFENRYLCKNGEYKWLSWKACPFIEEDLVYAIARDTTLAKQAEAELRLSHEILKQMPNSILVADLQGNIQKWLGGSERIFGYLDSEAIGQPIDFMHQPNLPQSITAKIMAQMPSNEVFCAEVACIRKDGLAVPIETTATRVYDSDGNPLVLVNINRDISERKQAEQALQKSENRYRGLVESQLDLIVRIDQNGHFTFVNDAYCQKFGKSRQELLGTSFFPLVHEEDLPKTLEVMQGLEVPPYRIYLEQRALTADGWRWIAWEDYAIKDEQGNTIEIQAVGRDITEKKQAEEALRYREQQFKALVENTPDLVIRCDRQGRYLYANPEVQRVTGMPAEALVGKTSEELGMSAELCQLWLDTIIKVFETGQKQTIEFQNLTLDGLRDYQSRVGPEYDQDGNIQSTLIVIRDITEQKQAEKKRIQLVCEQAARVEAEAGLSRLGFLAQASKILAASFDYKKNLSNVAYLAIPILADYCFVDLIDNEHQIQRIAVAFTHPEQEELFQQLYNYVPSQNSTNHPIVKVISSGLTEFVPFIDEAWLQKIAFSQEHLEFMRQFNCRSLISVPIKVGDRKLGALTFCFAESGRHYTSTDIALAEELATRAALAVENARLYHESLTASQMKDDFLAIVSHELRTPLNSVLGWTQLLRSRKFDEKLTAQALETIERNAKSQVQLIDEILEISRIVGGKVQLKCHPVKLEIPIYGAIDGVRQAAKTKQIQLISDIDTNVAMVAGDRDRLQQIVWHLLSNSIKFTPDHGQVELQLKTEGNHAIIRIIDNGKGIRPEFLPYVFESFRQAENAKTRSQGGLGLGLAIVYQLVLLHGGTVQAESEGEGKGAIFTVQLPILNNSNVDASKAVLLL